ncbi:hypothetical protein ACI797_11130 [Geodermatophilus sp. SYSU D00691]
MSAALQADATGERGRPAVSGDLPTVLDAAPMFRRAVGGYDRFQVDSYVRWAEEELATADREREHLEARHLRARAALEEARELLAHSSAGGDFLRLGRRMGTVLATAADQAEAMRADAEADRAAAAAEAQRVLAGARTEAERLVEEARQEAREVAAEAAQLVDEAERVRMVARVEAAERLAEVDHAERHAVERAERVRRRAEQDAAAATAHARAEIVQMLATGREQRRRADAEAEAARDRLDRDAATRRAGLLADVARLEARRAALQAELERGSGQAVAAPAGLPRLVRAPLERLRDHLVSRTAP